MHDLFHRTTKWVSYNRGTAIALFLAFACFVVLAVTTTGCDSKTPGLVNPTESVDRPTFNAQVREGRSGLVSDQEELKREIVLFNLRAEEGFTDLDSQDAFRGSIISMGLSIVQDAAEGKPIAWVGLIPWAAALISGAYGVGKKFDNKRKDELILDLMEADSSLGGDPHEAVPNPAT